MSTTTDLPTVAESYVHRIGRTARAGKDGIAIAFCAPDEIKMLRDIEKLTKMPLTVASGEPPADVRGGNQPSRGAARPARKPHRKGQGRPQQGGEGAEARGEQNARPARRPHAEAAGGGERKQATTATIRPVARMAIATATTVPARSAAAPVAASPAATRARLRADQDAMRGSVKRCPSNTEAPAY